MYIIKFANKAVTAETAKDALSTIRASSAKMLPGQATLVKKLQAGETLSLLHVTITRS